MALIRGKANLNFNKRDILLLLLVAISFISIFKAINPNLAFYQTLKLIEFILLYLYISQYAFRRFNLFSACFALLAGGFFQAIVAMAQFAVQHDLGLRIFGETALSPNLLGVASFFNIYGEKIMRPYGTTPHPNVLAAYLVLAIFAYYFLYRYMPFSKWLFIVYAFVLQAFLLTFSRVEIGLWFLIFIVGSGFYLFQKNNGALKKKVFFILLATLMVVGLFSLLHYPEIRSRIQVSADEEAVQQRLYYNRESVQHGFTWFGIGAGNFVPWLSDQNPSLPIRLVQPVHNIYLLILSELGILGLATFLSFIFLLAYPIFKLGTNISYSKGLFLSVVALFLITGLFDHFFWTLQQGRIMFWISLGYVASISN